MVTCAAVSASAGHERHRGGAAADHDDPLAGVVEVLGPGLGVDERALEASMPGEVGQVAVVVAVVAAAREEEAARELDRLAGVGALGR